MDSEFGRLVLAAVLIFNRVAAVVKLYSLVLKKILMPSAAFENLIIYPWKLNIAVK